MASDFNSAKVLKEIRKSSWNLSFDVAWRWFKEPGVGDEMEIQIRALVIISLKNGECLDLEVLAAQFTVCVYSEYLAMRKWGGLILFLQVSWHRN